MISVTESSTDYEYDDNGDGWKSERKGADYRKKCKGKGTILRSIKYD